MHLTALAGGWLIDDDSHGARVYVLVSSSNLICWEQMYYYGAVRYGLQTKHVLRMLSISAFGGVNSN